MRKKILIAISAILIIMVIFWIIGGINKNKRERENLAYYQMLLEEYRGIESLVERNLSFRGLVSLPDEEEINEIEQFGLNDMKISTDLSAENIKEYGRQIAKALEPYGYERGNEVLLVLEALTTQNIQAVNELNRTKNIHQNTIDQLKLITVPQDAQVIHLRLMNNIYNLKKQSEKMAGVLEDPALALENSQAYIKGQVNFFKAVEGVNVYFFRHGIIFNENEGINIYDSVGVVARPSN